VRGHTSVPRQRRLAVDRRDWRLRSLWSQQTIGDAATPQRLEGTLTADIAIVGGGYLGLWSAIELKRRQPALDVAVLEQEFCGSGASGRNGGQLHSWWHCLPDLIETFGVDEAVRFCRSADALSDRFDWLTEQGHPFDLRRDGWIVTATTDHQVGSWTRALDACRELGIDALQPLEPEELRHRTGSAGPLAGMWEPRGGTVHPGRLVAALRALAQRLGVHIYEKTAVESLVREDEVTLRTPRGSMSAGRVLLATGAWGASLPEFRHSVFVVASTIVATSPLGPEVDLHGIRGAAVCDSQALVVYYQATTDGRLVLGRGGGRVSLGGHVTPAFDLDVGYIDWVVRELRRLHPSISDAQLEHYWSGPVDRTVDGLPSFGDLDGDGKVFFGIGFSGTGILQTLVGAQISSSLLLGEDDQWSRCGLVRRPSRDYPPEPIRYLGARFVQHAVRRQSLRHLSGRDASPATDFLASLALGRHRNERTG
jgi:glycine/D-amino acid oxidase-like deaminating enzyme